MKHVGLADDNRARDGARLLGVPLGLYGAGAERVAMLLPMVTDAGTLLPALAAPVITGAGQSDTGGTLVASTTYGYKVTAFNGAGETLPSPEATVTTSAAAPATHATIISWLAVPGALGYKLYGRTSGGPWLLIVKLYGTGTVGYVDQGTIVPAGAIPGASTAVNLGINIGADRVYSILTRGQWLNWVYTSRADVMYRLSLNSQRITDWLPIAPYANEQAVAAGALAQFRPVPLYLGLKFDAIELASPNGDAQVNAMIGEGGATAT